MSCFVCSSNIKVLGSFPPEKCSCLKPSIYNLIWLQKPLRKNNDEKLFGKKVILWKNDFATYVVRFLLKPKYMPRNLNILRCGFSLKITELC